MLSALILALRLILEAQHPSPDVAVEENTAPYGWEPGTRVFVYDESEEMTVNPCEQF